jgi:predicted small secreted protein
MRKKISTAILSVVLAGCSSVDAGSGEDVSLGSDESSRGILVGFDESVKQFGQAAHPSTGIKPIHVHKLGIDFKRGTDGMAFINGKPASNDENNANSSVFNSGLITVILYKKTGKINAMEDGKFLGRLN